MAAHSSIRNIICQCLCSVPAGRALAHSGTAASAASAAAATAAPLLLASANGLDVCAKLILRGLRLTHSAGSSASRWGWNGVVK